MDRITVKDFRQLFERSKEYDEVPVKIVTPLWPVDVLEIAFRMNQGEPAIVFLTPAVELNPPITGRHGAPLRGEQAGADLDRPIEDLD